MSADNEGPGGCMEAIFIFIIFVAAAFALYDHEDRMITLEKLHGISAQSEEKP